MGLLTSKVLCCHGAHEGNEALRTGVCCLDGMWVVVVPSILRLKPSRFGRTMYIDFTRKSGDFFVISNPLIIDKLVRLYKIIYVHNAYTDENGDVLAIQLCIAIHYSSIILGWFKLRSC